MTLEELYRTISFAYDRANSYTSGYTPENIEVCIEVKVIGTVGPTPMVKIKHISMGNDWNRGKMIVVPEVDLRIPRKDEIKEIKEKYKELSFEASESLSLQKENEKLRKQVVRLKDKLELFKNRDEKNT